MTQNESFLYKHKLIRKVHLILKCFSPYSSIVHVVGVALKLIYSCVFMTVFCLVMLRMFGSGRELRGVCVLAGRGAAALVEGISGDLGSAGHCVAVDSAVELDYCGFGGHRGVAIFC